MSRAGIRMPSTHNRIAFFGPLKGSAGFCHFLPLSKPLGIKFKIKQNQQEDYKFSHPSVVPRLHRGISFHIENGL